MHANPRTRKLYFSGDFPSVRKRDKEHREIPQSFPELFQAIVCNAFSIGFSVMLTLFNPFSRSRSRSRQKPGTFVLKSHGCARNFENNII